MCILRRDVGVSVHGHTHALKTEVNIECLTCSFYLSSASTNSAWSIMVQLDHIVLMTRLYFSRKPSSSYVINLDAISPSLMSLLFHLPTHYNTSLSKHVINLQKRCSSPLPSAPHKDFSMLHELTLILVSSYSSCHEEVLLQLRLYSLSF